MTTATTTEHVRVGLGVLIIRGDTFLAGKRKGSHGSGQWAFPGGHFEYGESFEGCTLRELEEECGKDFKIQNLRFLMLYNMKDYMPKHYVHVGMVAEWLSGEPVNTEPNKLECWEWLPLKSPPEGMFVAAGLQLEAYRTGTVYKDS